MTRGGLPMGARKNLGVWNQQEIKEELMLLPPPEFQHLPPNGSLDNQQICSDGLQPYLSVQNENISEINQHLIGWLALHRERLSDCGYAADAEALGLGKIQAVAAQSRHPYAWTIAATMSLDAMYTAAVESFGKMNNDYWRVLALNARTALRQWIDYAQQHHIKVTYSETKKEEAESSARTFYSTLRQGMLADFNFQKMCQQSAMIEEMLREECPWLPRRNETALLDSTTMINSILSPNALPFYPPGRLSAEESSILRENLTIPDEVLDRYFMDITPSTSSSPLQYSDDEIAKVAQLLKSVNNGIWSRTPRLYIVLRRIGLLEFRNALVEDCKITDASFPFNESDLPHSMEKSQRCAFIQMQNCVLTKESAAAQCEDGGHAHFADQGQIPFQQDCILGSGGYAQVEKVMSQNTGKQYARKLLCRRALTRSHGSLFHFENELKILKRIRHQHVIRVVGSYTEPQFVAIIMSPIADCDLSEFLENRTTSPHSLSMLRTFPGCLATALHYLHGQGIRHKDIKPSNILVKGCTVLLTDFGLSRDCDNVGNTTSGRPGAFTLKYSAQEVVDQGRRSFPSDMWSMGCVLLEIFTVIQGISLSVMSSYFQNHGTKTKNYCHNPQSISGWIQRLKRLSGHEKPEEGPTRWIEQLLHRDSSKRPSARALAIQIANHKSATNRFGEFCGICCRMEHCDMNVTEIDDPKHLN